MSMSRKYGPVCPDTGESILFRKPYMRERHVTHVIGESATHQSHKDSCDVNKILKRYERTGMLPPSRGPNQFIDCTPLQGDPTELLNRSRQTLTRTREFFDAKAKEEADVSRKGRKGAGGAGEIAQGSKATPQSAKVEGGNAGDGDSTKS